MAVTEEARAARDAKVNELHERLTGAVATLVSGADWARALEFAARFRSRSFNMRVVEPDPDRAGPRRGRPPIRKEEADGLGHAPAGHRLRVGRAIHRRRPGTDRAYVRRLRR
mgnify:CR=1 FL=1